MSLPAECLPSPIERRNGASRRRPEPPELASVYRPDDRRLGLGRRWEDWCRAPASAADDPDESPAG